MIGVMESLLSHQSIRAYTEQPVEEEKIDQIIRALRRAGADCAGSGLPGILCGFLPYMACLQKRRTL